MRRNVGESGRAARRLERPDDAAVGDRGESGVHVEVGGVLQADGSDRDHEVAELDLGLQRAGRSDAHERGAIGDLHDLRQHDLDVVGAHPGGHAADPHPSVGPGRRRDLAIAPLELDALPARRDLPDATRITDEQDVLREVAALEVDVVLPLAGARCVGLGHAAQAVAPPA